MAPITMEFMCDAITGRWAGHIICVGEDDPAQKVYMGNIYNRKRGRGRSCLRWPDGVDQNAR